MHKISLLLTRTLLLLSAVLLGVCASFAQNSDVTENRTSCEAKGGIWGRLGLIGKEQCNEKTSDGGTVCQDSSECEGDCIAELSEEQKESLRKGTALKVSGRCTERKLNFGCLPFVHQGSIGAILCKD